MLLIDVHAHLHFSAFDKDLDSVLDRAKRIGVVKIINSGTDPNGNRLTLNLSGKYEIIGASLGLYPTLVDKFSGEQINEELEFIKSKKNFILSIGECGLDYQESDSKDKQKLMFNKVIELAEKINKPIIVHSRKAELDAIEMLESSKLKKIVLHCFSARKSLIKRAADNGWSFSIPPVVTRLQHFQTLAEMVNLSQLLTETDAPYLSPYPGERNEPAFVIEAIKKIAEIKRMTPEDVANNIYMNYTNMFL